MITISVNDEFIDISDSASFSIEGDSPFLNPGDIPGVKVYNVSALNTPNNQRVFGFSEKLNNTDRGKEFANVKIYFYNLLWKIGTFKLRNAGLDGYKFSFHTDAGDLQLKIKNRNITDIDMGTIANDYNHTLIYPDANHVFFTVKNTAFYDDKNPDYVGYINLYNTAAARFYTNVDDGGGLNKYTIMPFPYLLFVLNSIFTDLGYYGMEGDWTTDDNIKRTVIINQYAMDSVNAGVNEFLSDITYNRHVPDEGIGSFLIDVAVFFGITYKINPLTKKVTIIRIGDWLANQSYIDYTDKAGRKYNLEPNEYDGATFTMEAASDDALMDPEPVWLTHKEGNGQEKVETEASPLAMITENHPVTGGEWTIPHTEQAGVGGEFGMDIEPKSGLRFMLFTGTSQDGTGADYPQGHYLKAGFSLRWGGADGIVERSYRDWLTWKAYTELVEREVSLNVIELLQIDPENKVMLDNMKYVVGNYKSSISYRNGVRSVKMQTYSVKL